MCVQSLISSRVECKNYCGISVNRLHDFRMLQTWVKVYFKILICAFTYTRWERRNMIRNTVYLNDHVVPDESVFQIWSTRPALEILSPPPAVWLASVQTNTGATHTCIEIFSCSVFSISSQQDTGLSMFNNIRVPSTIDVEKLSSMISVAFFTSTCIKMKVF